jgi:hypothetical protein
MILWQDQTLPPGVFPVRESGAKLDGFLQFVAVVMLTRLCQQQFSD